MIFVIARILAIFLLLFALSSQPYEYYTVLRLTVCGVMTYSVFYSYNLKKENWSWTFGVIAFLFNPIFKINLGRGLWGFIDVTAAIILFISFFAFKEKK